MTKSLALLASAGLSLTLASCGGTQNRGLESVHQPVVDRAEYALDLATSGGELARGEQGRLIGWLDAMKLAYGDRVAVDDPEGSGSAARAEVGGVVAGYGLFVSDEAPITVTPVAPGAVRVVVSRMRAFVPGCPDWTRNSSINFDAHTSSNYGCANNTNLAAMIASPADLVRGRDGAPANDPALSFKAIDAYRKQPTTGGAGLPGGVTSVSVTKGSN